MDLREYEYITKRPDTFPRSTLRDIRLILSKLGSRNVSLIDKILHNGYIEPPESYKWHGCYKIILTDVEKSMVLEDLKAAHAPATGDAPIGALDRRYLEQYISYWSRSIIESPQSYDEYKLHQTYYDLRNISSDNFWNFIFDHEIDDREDGRQSWSTQYDMWIEYDCDQIVDLYVELFERSGELLAIFPKEKLEQGFWVLMGGGLECSVYNLIWKDALDIALKEKLILSIYYLYKNLYDQEPLETSSNMWWDSLAYSFYQGGPRDPVNDPNDKRIQDVMFGALKKILLLKSDPCQMAALHGLGHLRHPDTKSIIDKYIEDNSNLNDSQIAYAKACIEGDVM